MFGERLAEGVFRSLFYMGKRARPSRRPPALKEAAAATGAEAAAATCRDAYSDIMQRVDVAFPEVNQDAEKGQDQGKGQDVVDAVVADVVDAVVADVVDSIEVVDPNDAAATDAAGGGDSPSERLEPMIQRRAYLWDRNREKKRADATGSPDAAVSEGACVVS